MPDSVQLVVEIPPGEGKINGRFDMNWSPRRPSVRPTLRKSAAYRGYIDEVAAACRSIAVIGAGFRTGLVGVSITFYWPTQDHQTLGRDAGYPRGDVDSSVKATIDGLQVGGVFDSDARVVEIHVRKRYDPKRPRVALLVYALPDSA